MKSSYYIAVGILIAFFVITNVILAFSATTPSLLLAYGVPVFVGALMAVGFYYVFTHESLFPFATELAKIQKSVEKKWLKIISSNSKALTVFLLGTFGGPILAAFSVRFLMPESENKQKILFITGAFSGFFIASLVRGVFEEIVLPLLHFTRNVS